MLRMRECDRNRSFTRQLVVESSDHNTDKAIDTSWNEGEIMGVRGGLVALIDKVIGDFIKNHFQHDKTIDLNSFNNCVLLT